MKYLLLLSVPVFLFCTMQAQKPIVSSGTIQHFENFHSVFVTPKNIDVWLPDGYSPKRKYAVLYMHDGQMLFDSSSTWTKQEWGVDETMQRLIQEQKIKDCIVVAIWNSGKERWPDYMPQKPFESLSLQQQDSLYHSQRTNGPGIFNGFTVRSDKYLQFIVSEVKPFIDSSFSVYSDQQHTFIAGSSMGGLISLYAICEYPGVFGGAACLSTHWPGIFVMDDNPFPEAVFSYLKKHLPSPGNHKIYFDYGDQTLDALYPPLQKQVDAIMVQKKFTSSNWQTHFFPGEDHTERAWRKRLEIPLCFLLKQ